MILQGLRQDYDHETVVNELLTTPATDNFLFGLAFTRKGGVNRIKNNLRNVADKSKVFIGIRNGITSAQSIFALLKIGINPYVVDTASSKKILHPKIYAVYSETKAFVVLGSANLTFGGLNQNIEASSSLKLDRSRQSDDAYLQELVTTITRLPETYPDHVFQITNPRQTVKLLHEGRLEDERLVKLPPVTGKAHGNKAGDRLKPIPTFEKRKPGRNKVARIRKAEIVANTGILVWESKPLTKRSLNIPHRASTNITGDINLGQGLMEGIDFQHYFREKVFSDLNWSTDPRARSPHLERATINAEIVIKNISHGVYTLEVTHNPKTNTKSYRQGNTMTKIRWGEVRHLIAKCELLDSTLRLFKKNSTDFVIVID